MQFLVAIFFLNVSFGFAEQASMPQSPLTELYCARLGFANLDSARQSQIDPCRRPSQFGNGAPPSAQELCSFQFGFVSQSPNSQNLSGRSIGRDLLPKIFPHEEGILQNFVGKERYEEVRQGQNPLLEQHKIKLYHSSNHYVVLKKMKCFSVNDVIQVERILQFEAFLGENGIPIPYHWMSYQKKNFFLKSCREAGHSSIDELECYILQDYIEGRSWKGNHEQISSFARVLRRMHNLSEKYSGPFDGLPEVDLFQTVRNLYQLASQELREKRRDFGDEIYFIKWEAFVSVILKQLEELCESAYLKGYRQEKLVIHGDFHPENVIFGDQGEAIGIVDFDNCCIDDPCDDLIRGLLHVCVFSFNQELPEQCSPEIFLARAECFLREYAMEGSLITRIMRPYLPEIVRAISLQIIALYHLRGLQNEIPDSQRLLNLVNQVDDLVKSAIQRLKLGSLTVFQELVDQRNEFMISFERDFLVAS